MLTALAMVGSLEVKQGAILARLFLNSIHTPVSLCVALAISR